MSNELKKICVICVSGLPVPPVKGGAIEGIVQNIIDENEKAPRFKMVVLTTEDAEAQKTDIDYKHTEYIRFKLHLWTDRVKYRVQKMICRFFGKEFHYIGGAKRDAANYLKDKADSFDLIIEENGMEVFQLANNAIPFNKRVYHCHGTSGYNLENAKCAKHFFTVSQFVAKEWIDLSNTSKQFVHPIVNAINVSEFNKAVSEQEKELIRKGLDIDENKFVVLYCGRLIENKGVRELVKAVNSLNDSNIALLIIGSAYYKGGKTTDPYIVELHRLSEESISKIIFVGYVEHSELYKYHAIANVGVMPSLWEESAGLAALESEASGNATIVTNTGGLPEMVPEGCGIIIEVGNNLVSDIAYSIKELKDNPSLCRSYGAAGKKHAMNCDISRYFIKFANEVDKIITTNDDERMNEILE